MFEARSIAVRYGRRTVLEGVSLDVAPGSLTALVGCNGAGKTTLLRALCGDIPIAAGAVALDRQDLHAIAPEILARRRAVLPQASRLAFPYTVYEVVRLGLIAAGAPRETEGARIAVALAAAGLEGFGPRLYQELSGGEQQRVNLARVLCQVPEAVGGEGPRYLFLDEATAGLDLRHQLAALATARAFADAGGGVLAILHDLNLAAMFADRIAVVHDGRLAGIGPPGEVLNDALLHEVFGVPLQVGAVPQAAVPFVLPQTLARK
ncbi:MAG TPA: heme ABC transporter ATP-binding protein [Hyphomicrobiales bacterium]|nr:heme ABC transporter ATP-binding protein [Hyphomicrobiales bacterium]